MGWGALWMTRFMMLWGVVLMPVAVAGGTWRNEDTWPWVPYLAPPVLLATAVAGAVYSGKRWNDPPGWAVFLARTCAYRDRWHRP